MREMRTVLEEIVRADFLIDCRSGFGSETVGMAAFEASQKSSWIPSRFRRLSRDASHYVWNSWTTCFNNWIRL
jgi:hypothetical protein